MAICTASPPAGGRILYNFPSPLPARVREEALGTPPLRKTSAAPEDRTPHKEGPAPSPVRIGPGAARPRPRPGEARPGARPAGRVQGAAGRSPKMIRACRRPAAKRQVPIHGTCLAGRNAALRSTCGRWLPRSPGRRDNRRWSSGAAGWPPRSGGTS